MENKETTPETRPFLFEFLEEFPIMPSASTYTNLGLTGTNKQDSDDE